ncbi:hypothetical protein FUAX_00660 [Fulvitalea axinellae]|uniref:Uncharacterized protein n=1 Tax=Fulvitalea axinellae TaxID=1182444 RepID=A0AAU9C6M4_9BACT|nr:hypothetical protein FUAX_00660 [Fulvitalea axinellae]
MRSVICRWLFALVLCFGGSTSLLAQSHRIVEFPDSVGVRLNARLANARDSLLRNMGSDFLGLWEGANATTRKRITDVFSTMLDKSLRVVPHVSGVAELLVKIDASGRPASERDKILSVFEYAAREYPQGRVNFLMARLKEFYGQSAIRYENRYQLLYDNGSYSIELPEGPVAETEEEDWEEASEPVVQSGSWDDNDEEEDSEDEPDDGPGLTKWDEIPSLEIPDTDGVSIKFDRVNLTFQFKTDTVTLTGTHGVYWPERNLWIGKGGSMSWPVEVAGAVPQVTLDEYVLDLEQGTILSQKAMLAFSGKLSAPAQGEYRFKLADYKKPKNSWPRFASYRSDLEIKSMSEPRVRYTGGISLKGAHFGGESLSGGKGVMFFSDGGQDKFRVISKKFDFTDSTMFAPGASLKVFQYGDSLYHPYLDVHYEAGDTLLWAQKTKNKRFQITPFTASYFGIKIKADYLEWNPDTDSLNISILKAREQTPAFFESDSYFSRDNYSEISDSYRFNPLGLIIHYKKETGAEYVTVADLDEFYKKIRYKNLEQSMYKLREYDLIRFDERTGEISLTKMADFYLAALRKTADYDELTIPSRLSSAPNGTLHFGDSLMTVRGVSRFDISKKLNVYVEPEDKEVHLMKGQDFKFDGKLFSGIFEFVGQDFTFRYDDFLVDLQKIDSIRFQVEDTVTGEKMKVQNKLVGDPADTMNIDTSQPYGTLYINRPGNKSGNKVAARYPYFSAQKGARVYFDNPNVLDGAYDKSVYFEVPPFAVDSLNAQDFTAIGFEGTFVSGGIFPDFKQKLSLMPDNSLGFKKSLPAEGYMLYEDPEGKYYDSLTLDARGLRGHGKVSYLTSNLESKDFIFYQDSVSTIGTKVEVGRGEHNGASFPDLILENYQMSWKVKQDSLILRNLSDTTGLMTMYEYTALLDGQAVITKKGLRGAGVLQTRFSETHSGDYHFKADDFSAQNANFEIKSDNPEKPAVFGDDVELYFNIAEDYADISPEKEGVAALSFPYSQFNTSITNARWLLQEDIVKMSKPEEVDITSSYFYSTRPDLDSLVFNASAAEYNMNTLELNIQGIPHIVVADAFVIPEGNQVMVLENSSIERLKNAELVVDTLNKYHRLVEGNIEIKSRLMFEGDAKYRYVNAVADTFILNFDKFEYLDYNEEKRERRLAIFGKVAEDRHTVSGGEITPEDELVISPGMLYKGPVRMEATKKALMLDGHVKLDLKSKPFYDKWIRYASSDERQQEVMFDFETSLAEGDENLIAGLFYEDGVNVVYPVFVDGKRQENDQAFFTPAGLLHYDPKEKVYLIEDTLKRSGGTYVGKVFQYSDEDGSVGFEGPVDLLEVIESKKAPDYVMDATAIDGKASSNSGAVSFNSFMVLEMPVPDAALAEMGRLVSTYLEERGAVDAEPNRVRLLYKLAEFIGDRGVKEYEERAQLDYVPIVSLSGKLSRGVTLSNVNMEWSEANTAWYSKGKIGISNILANDVNHLTEAFLEVDKTGDGDNVNFFFKVTGDIWYFFKYSGSENSMQAFSSDDVFNGIIGKRANVGKAKIGELVLDLADTEIALEFINRFRMDYEGKDPDYKLEMPADVAPTLEDSEEYVDPLFTEDENDNGEEKTYSEDDLFGTEDDKPATENKEEDVFDMGEDDESEGDLLGGETEKESKKDRKKKKRDNKKSKKDKKDKKGKDKGKKQKKEKPDKKKKPDPEKEKEKAEEEELEDDGF